jgi:hypothetical protein
MSEIKIKTVKDLADALISVGDLDPVYQFANKCVYSKGSDWTQRFSLHFLLFYDLGGAVAAAEQTSQTSFWPYVKENFSDFPRTSVRMGPRMKREFVENLSQKFPLPYSFWDKSYHDDYDKMVEWFKTQAHNCGFGDYFRWKTMDFHDRVFDRRVRLSLNSAVQFLPSRPVKVANQLWKSPVEALLAVQEMIHDWAAPGAPSRGCGPSEAETVLCAIHEYFFSANPKYIGSDVDECYHSLRKFREFQLFLPTKLNWSVYERPHALDTSTLSN